MPRPVWGVEPARKRRFRLSTPNQGLLAITFFEAISFSILLVLFFLLDRGRPARFFRFWIAGWVALTLWSGLLILSPVIEGNASRLVALEFHVSGAALFLAAVWEYTGRRVRPHLFWPLLPLAALVLASLDRHPAPPPPRLPSFTPVLLA